jgi:hypothetical protein
MDTTTPQGEFLFHVFDAEPQPGALAGGSDHRRHRQAGRGSMMVSDVLLSGSPSGVSVSVMVSPAPCPVTAP